MPFAPGTFSPSGRFSFPRSYINKFKFQRLGGTIIHSNNQFGLNAPPPNPAQFYVEIDLAFWAWSSNARTMDHIIVRSDYTLDPFSPITPMPFILAWYVDPSDGLSTLDFAPFGLYGDPVDFPFHAAPPSYWLPPPLL